MGATTNKSAFFASETCSTSHSKSRSNVSYGCKQAMEQYKSSPSAFEKFVDDRLMMLAKESCKRTSEGAEPLLGYYLGEEAQNKVLHIIYSGVKTGADTEIIRERLREIYG